MHDEKPTAEMIAETIEELRSLKRYFQFRPSQQILERAVSLIETLASHEAPARSQATGEPIAGLGLCIDIAVGPDTYVLSEPQYDSMGNLTGYKVITDCRAYMSAEDAEKFTPQEPTREEMQDLFRIRFRR